MKLTRMLSLLLALITLTTIPMAAFAEEESAPALRSWTKKEGYVYVHLGEYPQTKEGGVEPLLWRVLTVDEERAYLCSEYILFAMPMHVNYTEYKKIGKDFGNTELCAYLNGQFSEDAFKHGELALMMEFETYGKVFLLDSEDLKNTKIGMGRGENLKAWGTDYAKANGLYVFQRKYGAHSPYWTRNQATTDTRHARCTKDGGQIGHIVSNRENEGVRPAIYLDMSLVQIAGGTGTMEDPFTLVIPEVPETDAN